MKHPLRYVAAFGAITAIAATAHTIHNARTLPSVRPQRDPATATTERVSVLLPARDESQNIGACIASIVSQSDVDEIIVLDDASTDGTAAVAIDAANSDPRVCVQTDLPNSVPAGWLGKSWACERLARSATGDVLIFIDADVRLREGAVNAAVMRLRELELDMLCPYPQQAARTTLTRIVQPLLQWSWLTFIPGEISMRQQLPSMAVGNGQFMVVDARAYRAVGGHSAVAADVLEDVALARIFREFGLRTAVVDGSEVATCQMYRTDTELVDGYTKSLWDAFGSESAAIATLSALKLIYVLPPFMAVVSNDRNTRLWGALGYLAAVTGRVVVARRTGQRVWPDSLAAPVSVAALSALTVLSIRRHRRGTIVWKGRGLPE